MNFTNQLTNYAGPSLDELAGKKILFANFPGDGHFNPLTGLAVHMKSLGSDVRWYSSSIYASKLNKLQIFHYPFQRAKDVNAENLEQVFPERSQIKGIVKKLNFDMINAFILRGPEYYADLLEIHRSFPFDVVVADCTFTGIPFITDLMQVPVISIGVFPLIQESKDLAPSGLGMTPSYSFMGKIKQALLRYAANKILFAKPNKVMKTLLTNFGIEHQDLFIFDLMARKSTLYLQSGTPGFEYARRDLPSNVRFIGPLLPYQSQKQRAPWFDERLNQYEKIVIVTQGTVEKDIEKILVPTLEAFKDSDTLVIATTGGSGTEVLRKRFNSRNLIIEDFIPFSDIMPYADAYITNGGYGGVLLGIESQLPLVVAGVHEGKNEINARIGYFNMGVNVKTEKPTPAQMKKAVIKVLSDDRYKQNVSKLAKEFSGYNPKDLFAYYLKDILKKTGRLSLTTIDGEKIY